MEIDNHTIKVGLDNLLEIAQERKVTLEKLKEALIKDDTDKIKKFASQLCGLSNESC